MSLHKSWILIFVLLQMGCASIFWRSASLDPVTVSSGESKIVYQVFYLERNSWNPLMGTTLKKSYKTKLTYIGAHGSSKELPAISSWVLPGMLFYQEEGMRLFWIQGIDDGYGTMARKAGVAEDILSKTHPATFRYWEEEKELLELQPSSDGNHVAYVYRRETSPLQFEYYIAVWNHAKEKAPSFVQKIRAWDESQDPNHPKYRLIWNGNKKLRVVMEKEEILFTLPVSL